MELRVDPPTIPYAYAVPERERNFKLQTPGNPIIELNAIMFVLP
jgi:hypothetical protein